MLLNAPGNGPTPICLFRQGDVDWLCLTQVRKLLIRKAHRASVRDRVSRCEMPLSHLPVFSIAHALMHFYNRLH